MQGDDSREMQGDFFSSVGISLTRKRCPMKLWWRSANAHSNISNPRGHRGIASTKHTRLFALGEAGHIGPGSRVKGDAARRFSTFEPFGPSAAAANELPPSSIPRERIDNSGVTGRYHSDHPPSCTNSPGRLRGSLRGDPSVLRDQMKAPRNENPTCRPRDCECKKMVCYTACERLRHDVPVHYNLH